MEPVVARHVVHEDGFADGGGLVFFTEVGDELVELFARFAGEEAEGSRKAVAEIVAGGDGFAFFGGGTG